MEKRMLTGIQLEITTNLILGFIMNSNYGYYDKKIVDKIKKEP